MNHVLLWYLPGKAKRRHLNTEECHELGQSAEGTDVLTRPNTVNQALGRRDPNQQLYPRTPTKRQKCGNFSPFIRCFNYSGNSYCIFYSGYFRMTQIYLIKEQLFLSPAASVSGSPSGQQKSINSFFSVTGVISSSPHKSSQPCSSTSTSGVNLELFPQEDDDDDDDDISLLAAPIAAELESEKNEVDDESLLAAELMLQPDTRQVDYLEGMTAEMFGHDEDFDKGDSNYKEEEEEEVEALPDKHYGLLGNNKVLQEPQGCMNDLPEEVLRHVLGFVPAQDLYRSAIVVCHRWRNIVKDTKVKHEIEFYLV